MKGLKEAVEAAHVDELLSGIPGEKLLAIVMRLTNGQANPSRVRQSIERIKSGNHDPAETRKKAKQLMGRLLDMCHSNFQEFESEWDDEEEVMSALIAFAEEVKNA